MTPLAPLTTEITKPINLMKKLPLKFSLLAIVAAVVSSALPAGAQSLWNAVNGVSANTNWSTAANWSPSSVPGATSNVLFLDTAVTAPGVIDNVVDVNTTILRLAYRQTNGIHNTLILPGVTLTITNSPVATNLLVAGTENAAGSPTTLIVTNTISGAGGTLTITSTNLGSSINVRQITTGAAGSHLSVLDISGLDNFNVSIGFFFVGVFGGTGTTRPQGVLFLAKTNNITLLTSGTKLAPSLDVGDTGSSPDVGNTLALGITNKITADSIVIGNQRSGGIFDFNPAFTNITTPSLYLRGNTNSRVTTFNIGDNSSASAAIGSSCSGVVDFSGGTVNALVGSMTLGYGQPIGGSGATGTATGTLTITAGTLDVNTLDVAIQTNTAVVGAATGTVNINGGKLTVNTSLRVAFYGGAGGLSRGTLNITNGTVQANSIVAGGGTSTVNMSGGTNSVTTTMGSVASPLSALNLSSGATLQLPAASGVTPAVVTNLSSDSTGVIGISSLPALAGYPSQFPLISYQTGGSGVTFSVGALPGTFTGFISNDNSSVVWLVVTNGPSLASVTWGGGVNNLWDTNALNWTNNGVAVKYRDLDVVTFDDSAKTNNVYVTNTFMPAAWLQNNSVLNYTFTGVGSISGSCGLVMNGAASVTLAETGGDNFSGGIMVNNGTVVLDDANSAISGGLTIASGAMAQIGKNDANGNLPSGALHDEGTLIFNRTDNVLVSTVIPGVGALVQNGSGTLTLSAANTYTGNTTINAGTLALTNSGSIASSAQVSVTGAKLDVSGVPGITTLTSLNLTNANLTVSASALQTNLSVSSLNLGGFGNTISVSSLPPIGSYPTTIAVVQSANAISGFNMSVGTLPAGSTGSVALSGDTTTILLTLTSGPVGVRPNVIWSGGDSAVRTNWSDRLNWQLPGAPVAADNVIFNNTATAVSSDLSTPGGGASALIPDNINNFVDANFTIASLTYTNNGGNYHNTAITNGATLTVTNLFAVGAVDSASTLQQEYVNIAGGGSATLNVNNTNASLQVWMGNSGTAASFAALDLSALDNFTANVNRLTVGACAVNNAVNRPSGILYLAKINTINCTFQTTTSEAGSTTGNSGIVLGDCNQNQGPTSLIYLGQVNTISADTIGIARQKSSGTVQFNSIYANVAPYPSVTFKGFSSALVSNFDIGDGIGNTGTTAGTGDLNLAGGFVTATVDTMNIGRASGGASGSGTTTGSLEFDAGTITANTVNVGLQPATGTKGGVGTVTVGTNTTIGAGATLVVNGNLNLGVNVNSGTTAGTLNINGGMVQANNIVAGINGAPSTVNLNAGALIVTGTAGTTAAPLTTLSLSDGTTLQLAVNGSANVTNIVATSITTSGTTTLKIGSLSGVVTNVTYPLISYTGTDPFSSFSSPVLPSGYSGSLIDNSGNGIVGLKLTAVPPPPQPAHFTGISVSGTTLNITATNGVHGGQYVLLGTTNLVKPLNQWTRILTNNFNGSGNLNLSTNIINPAVPQQFYIISQ
jgi:autotransporter-associated beta strand protein